MFKDKKFLLNPNRIIAPGVQAKELNNKTLNDIIDIFESRINAFYFKGGDLIRDQEDTDLGFFLIELSAIIIDLLSQYENNLPCSDSDKFREYLKTHIPDFNNRFKNVGKMKYFKGNQRRPKFITVDSRSIDYAEAFWDAFRNAIVHNAMILSFGGYDTTPTNIIKEEPWTDDTNTQRVEQIIHPFHLYDNVKKVFKEYFKNLRDLDPQYEGLRNNFKEKFLKDFGFGE